MNTKMIEEMDKAARETADASLELSLAAQDYEKRREIAQRKLTIASGRLSTLTQIAKGTP